jgi:hypothetical protein
MSVADEATTALLNSGVRLQLGSGRRQSPVAASFARELTVEDLVGASTQEAGIKSVPIKELRQSHHMLARTMAQGLPDAEVSVICGYSISRISILRGDPTFMELLAYYEDMEKKEYAHARADMHERLRGLGFDAVEILHDKLRDDPDSFDPKTLLSIVEATSDRTGHGKTATVQHNHDVSLSPQTIERIKLASGGRGQVTEADRQALQRLALARTAELDADAEEAHWEPSEGGGLREEGDQLLEEEVPSGQAQLPSVD